MALVCHMEKYKQSDCGGIQTEDNRESDAINKKNPNLDLSRTHLNKHFINDWQDGFVEHKRSALVSLVKTNKDRINILKTAINKPKLRKDAVVCCSFIIGADNDYLKTLSYEEQIRYFKTAVDFFEKNKKFGTVLEFSLHFDESTPHMHLRMLPEYEVGELSAKKMFTPKTLSEIQRKLPLWMQEHGFEVDAGKENSKAKHLNEAEYRIKCADDKIKTLENKIDMLLSHAEALERGLKASYEAEELLTTLNGLKELLPPDFADFSAEQSQKLHKLHSRIQKAHSIAKNSGHSTKPKKKQEGGDAGGNR